MQLQRRTDNGDTQLVPPSRRRGMRQESQTSQSALSEWALEYFKDRGDSGANGATSVPDKRKWDAERCGYADKPFLTRAEFEAEYRRH